MRVSIAVCLALLGVATSVAFAASAAQRSVWVPLGGDGGKQSTQLGLLRSGGVLHVVSAQGAPASLVDTQLNGSGKVQRTATVASNFDSAGGLSLVGMADGSVRLFAAGGDRPGLASNLSGINSFVSAPRSTSWALDPTALWGGAAAGASDEIGATRMGDQPVTAWSGGFVHVGLRPSAGPDPNYQPDCCGIAPQLATDAATGAVVMSWLSNGRDSGTYVKQVLPTIGATESLPSGLTEGSSGIAARSGAPGTFVAFTDPSKQLVELHQYGGRTFVVARGSFRVAKVFSAPEGRLWVLWGDANSAAFVTRSNKVATRWEPVQRLPLPSKLTAFYNAQGEGSAGPLDAFVDLLVGSTDRRFWRAHVLPQPSLAAAITGAGGRSQTQVVSFRVTDAGDPLKGAIIVVARGGTTLARLRTDANGHASTSYTGPTRLTATASAPGYDSAIITVGH